MQRALLFYFLFASTILTAQQSSLTIFGPSSAFCTSELKYNVNVTNIDVVNDPISLFNTKVVMEVFNEGEDPNVSNPFLIITEEGPIIEPGASHLFEMIIPAKTIVASGNYQIKFRFHALADENDMSDNPIFNLSYSFCGITYEQAKEKVMEYAEVLGYGEYQIVIMPEDPLLANTVIESLNTFEFSDTLTETAYFAWILSDIFSAFEQPSKYILLDPFTCEMTIYETRWWPSINGEEYTPSILDGDVIVMPDISEEELEPMEFIADPQVNESKSCAVLVAGRDNDIIDQGILPRAIEAYKQNLIRNPLGPKLQEDQIILLDRKTKAEIKAEIEKTQQGYDCVYFYYVGHGGSAENGNSLISNHDQPELRYNHKDLVEDLLNSEAKKFRIVIDCCYAGQFIDEVKINPKSEGKDIQILTSSSRDKSALIQVSRRNDQSTTGLWIFSHYMNTFSGDPSADYNGDGKVDLVEINRKMLESDPFFISSRESFIEPTCPQIFGQIGAPQVKTFIKAASEESANNLGVDQVVAVHPELLPAGTKIESFNTEEFSLTTNKPYFLGWSTTNILNDYEQPSKLFLLDPETGEVQVEDLNWWTKIDGENWFPPLNGPEFIDPPTFAEVLPTYSILEDIEKIEDPKTCALLLSGIDGSETRMDIFKNDVNELKNSIQNSPFGPKLPDSQVIVRNGISKDSLKQLIKELRYGYDIVYFYFRGNGTKDGRMATGSGQDEFYAYDEFINDLFLTGAELINLLADCSYSGNLVNSINSNSKSCFKDISVSTSTSDLLPSRTILGSKDGKIIGFGTHTFTFNLFNRDVEIDINNDGINAFDETAIIMEEEQPFDPFGLNPWEYQEPQRTEKEYDEVANNLVYIDFLSGINPDVFDGANVYADVKELGQVAIQYYEDLVFEKPENSGILVFEPNISDLFPKDYGIGLISYADDCSEQSLEYYPFENGEFPLNLSADDLVTTSLSEEKQIRQGTFEISPEGLPLLADGGEIPTSNERGALLIADYITNAWEPQIRRGLEAIGRKITNEEFGPKVQQENINVFTTINEKLLCEEIEGQKDRYRHLYFYLQLDAYFDGVIFRGELTRLNSAPDLSPGISYHEIFCKLVETNIDTLTIILETGSDIEIILEAIETSKLKEVNQVNIFTSSYNGLRGKLVYNSDGDHLVGSNATNIFSKVGDIQSDINEDGEIQMVEAFIGYNQGNPGNPLAFSTWWETKSANDNSDFSDFSNVNLTYDTDPSNPQKFRVQTQISVNSSFPESLQELFEEASKRTTSIRALEGFLFRDSQEGQIQFKVDSILDYMENDEGIMGLLYRKDESSEWSILDNVEYNEITGVLTTDTINICGDFIIARVNDMSSYVSEINTSTIDIKALPSVFTDELNLEFALETQAEVQFNLVNMGGKVVKSINNQKYLNGVNTLKINTESFPAGNYIVQLIEDQKRSKLLMVTKI